MEKKIDILINEVLSVEIYSMIDYYPGNPDYIGKDRYKGIKESDSIDGEFHYYVGLIPETTIKTLYHSAQLSLISLSIEQLKGVRRKLKSLGYQVLYEEIDSLQLKFLTGETSKKDEYRFKELLKKHFVCNIPQTGRISTMFIGSLGRELKQRTDYLEGLKDDVKDEIDQRNNFLESSVDTYKYVKAFLNGVDLKYESNLNRYKPVSRTYNDVKPITENTMEINYELIFANALNYADDPEEMKEFCIRQQKEAAKKHFKEESFYKGLLKIVAKERDLKNYGIVNYNTIVDESFIYVPSGIKYAFDEIDQLEKIIHGLCYQGEAQQVAKVSETQEKNQSAQAIQISNEEKEAKKKRDKPGRKKAVPKNAREYLRFIHAESKDTFIYHLKKLSYIHDKKEFAHLIMAINNINMLKEATKKEWKEAFEKELQGVIQTEQNFNYKFNKKDPQLLGTISTELKSIIQKNNLI